MSKTDGHSRRNADKDLSELVRIFGKLKFEDFMTLFEIFENYRDKTSSLRIMRLLYDALSICRIRQLKTLAPPLEVSDDWAKAPAPFALKLSRARFKNGVTPARLLKGRPGLGPVAGGGEPDILDSGLTERMRHKT